MTCRFVSTKTYDHLGPVAYRQWRAESHCDKLHGYALSFHFEFESDELDVRNWVVDYGGLRPLKELLEEWFDHTLLVAEDDPMKEELRDLETIGLAKVRVVERTGCEGIADYLYCYLNDPIDGFLSTTLGYGDRVWCSRVEVRETPSNMAARIGHREDWS
ncbi:hypothetical protein LCGC14_3112980, partial [marine sediment metagenome]